MYKILIVSLLSILLISGCDEKSSKRALAPVDNTPPQAPKVVMPESNGSLRESPEIELKGEPESAVLIDDKIVAQLDKKGYAKVTIPLAGEDGQKSVKLEIEDAYGNRSEPVEIHFVKDTTPPVITLKGEKVVKIELDSNFSDPGAGAIDNIDADVTVTKSGKVDSSSVGRYIIQYSAEDKAGNRATAQRVVYVKKEDLQPINHAPELKNSIKDMRSQDSQSLTVKSAESFSDPDGDTLHYNATGLPSGVNIDSTTGIISGVLAKDASSKSPCQIKVTATDPEGLKAEMSFKLNVTNPAPEARDDSVEGSENQAFTVDALANDSDPDGDAITLKEIKTAPANGIAKVVNSKIVYTPNSGFSGTDSLEYTIADAQGASSSAMVYFKINHINHTPQAKDDTLELNEDTNKTIDILNNDSDADGDTLTIKSFTQPANGTVKETGKKLQYIPNPNYNGNDSFTYTVTDGDKEATATVTITVNPVNDAPILNPIADITLKDTESAKEIILQATDIDSQNLTYKVTQTDSDYFTTQIDGNKLTVTPKANSNAQSEVTVTVKDDKGASDTKSFKVTVSHTNLAPQYQNNLEDINKEEREDLNVDINKSFKDPEGEVLTYTVDGLPQGITLNPTTDKISGTLDKAASSQSPYSIKVTATDPEGLSSEATFNLIVTNPSPTAQDDNITLSQDTNVTVDALANDSDPDGDAITLKEIKTAPANGIAKVVNSKIVYTPNSGFSGSDSLEYTIADAQGASSSAVINFTVSSANHAPEYVGSSATIELQSNWHDKDKKSVSSLFNDADGDTLQYNSSNIPSPLTLESTTGEIAPNFNIKDMQHPVYDFNITVSDPSGESITVPVKWTLTGNYIEQNRQTAVQTVKNRGVSFYPYKDVIATWDIDYGSVTIKEQPVNGSTLVDFNGTIIYRPNKNYTGNDTLKYTICDNQEEPHCSDGNISISVADLDSNSSVQTNWGFQEFDVPDNTITLHAGDNIQNALNDLSDQGGGKLILGEGVYKFRELSLPSNIVIEGAGIQKTILKPIVNTYHLLEARDAKENIAIRGMTLDCRDRVEYGCAAFNYGVKNVLVENIEVFGAGRSDISAYNEDWTDAGHFTIRNNIIYSTVNYHGVSLRFIKGAIVANNIIYKTAGDGIDMSRVIHGEVTNNSVIDTGYGTKFPGSDYLYMHNNYIDEVWIEGGIKFNPLSEDYNREHIDIEDNVLKHTRGGIIDWGDSSPAPHFTEFVAKNNTITLDYNDKNMIRVKSGINLYDYGNDVRGREGQVLTDEFNNIVRKSVTDSPKLDGVGYTTWGKNYSFENKNIYKPILNFSVDDVYNSGNIVEVSNMQELADAIANATAKTTILLNDGNYSNVNIEFPKGLHDVTIKAKGDSAIIEPKGREDDSAFTLPNVATPGEQVHNINFIGLKIQGSTTAQKQFVKSVHGRWVDSNGNLHDYGANNPKYGPYNIYFKNITTENLFMGLYSGLYAHDWTVDNCTMKKSTYSHFWYMMGWHLAVINSTFEDATHDALAIRGYYPEGEVHTYIGKEDDTQCYGNKYVEDRVKRDTANGFLPADEWTHTVKNNTFKRVSTIRDNSHSYIAIAYSVYSEDPVCGAEKTYLPPQNVEISGNIIDNNGDDEAAVNNAVAIDARAGIDNSSKSSVNGIKVVNNSFYKEKDEEKFLTTDDSNTDLSVLRSYQIFHNITSKNN